VADLDLTGDALDWRDAKRAEIVRIAIGELGNHGKGSARVRDYWRAVLPKQWSDARVKEFAKKADWCGGFVLWCYRQAGVALDIDWIMGKGFARPQWVTRSPLPGDLCIRPLNARGKPVWHHALVESLADGVLATIDGNQPGVCRRVRPAPTSNMVYYSTESLLAQALESEAGRLRDA
jgi:hypothetical protein